MPEEANRLAGRTTVARNVGMVLLVVVLAVAVITAPSANWDLALLGVLLGFAAFSDLTAKVVDGKAEDLGQLPGAGPRDGLPRWLARRPDGPGDCLHRLDCAGANRCHSFIQNLLNYSLFTLAGGLAFQGMVNLTGVNEHEVGFYILIFGVFCFALMLNFSVLALYIRLRPGNLLLQAGPERRCCRCCRRSSWPH